MQVLSRAVQLCCSVIVTDSGAMKPVQSSFTRWKGCKARKPHQFLALLLLTWRTCCNHWTMRGAMIRHLLTAVVIREDLNGFSRTLSVALTVLWFVLLEAVNLAPHAACYKHLPFSQIPSLLHTHLMSHCIHFPTHFHPLSPPRSEATSQSPSSQHTSLFSLSSSAKS